MSEKIDKVKISKEDEEVAKLAIGITDVTDFKTDWEKLVSFSEKNEIIIPVLVYLKKEKLSSERFILLYNKKMQEYQFFWQEVRKIHKILSEEGIDYALIKTNRNYKFYDWDINILIGENDWYKVLTILSNHGWRKSGPLKHPLASEPGKLLLEKVTGFPLHLHRDILWNGIKYIPGKFVLSERIEVDGIYCPSLTMDVCICLAESIFEDYNLSLGKVYFIMKNLDNRILDHIFLIAHKYGWLGGAELGIRVLKEIWNAINRGEKMELPYKYKVKDLLRVWSKHAWANKKYVFREVPVNLVRYMLTKYILR